MVVGIDARKLGDGGIGEYIRETVAALVRLRPDLGIVAFTARGGVLEGVECVEVDAGKYSAAEHWRLPRAARRARVDLYHAPHYVLPLALPRRAVVTVHDLIHVLFPRSALHSLYARAMIGFACRRAARVITVSETTARDLRSRFRVPSGKLRVVPNGVSPDFRPVAEAERAATLARLGVERPYVLFVGNWLPHKNVETLVRAWGSLAAPRPALVLCGGGFEAARPVWQAVREVGGGVRVLAPVGRADLVALYGGAEALASASLYEGFCLPIVEAFACGTPVVGPDAGAVPEVAGDAALLAPPQRVDMIAAQLYRLLTDRGLRSRLVEKGRRRALGFSWDEAARKTLAIYDEVMREGTAAGGDDA